MKKFLSIYFPFWSIAVAERKLPGKRDCSGWLLAGSSGQQLVVKRFCRAARAAGVKEEMPLPLARAMIPGVRVESFEPLRDLRALYRLARWAVRLTPFAGLDADLISAYRARKLEQVNSVYWGLVLDLSGTERLHKGTDNLARRLYDKFRRWGIEARLALAPTIGAGWALARFGDRAIMPFSEEPLTAQLAKLPVEALRLSPPTVAAFNQLGIDTIERLLALPREALPQRFGEEVLLRIDQALGRREETFRAVHAPQQFSARRFFETPLTRHEQVSQVLLALLQQVVRQLGQKKKKAGYFILKLQGIDDDYRNRTLLKRVSLFSASERFAHIAGVLQPIIESLHMPHGIYGFTVVACSIMSASEEQPDFVQQRDPETAKAQEELLNHLVVRLGPEQVTRIKFNESYMPERSFAHQEIKKNGSAYDIPAPAVTYVAATRPSYIFSTPEAVEVIALLPDRPAQLDWKGRRYRLVCGTGPERIEPEWWESELGGDAPSGRDYFKVQDETGRWLWLFRDRATNCWFVHGIWA